MAMTFYEWKVKMRAELDKIHRTEPFSKMVTCSKTTKWLIAEMVTRDISFKIINHGGGVKTITTDVDVCPKCNGTGRC